ncbi:MAG: hypothetical protein H6719_09795 [Sandaracinaceae bacterium]|nr:hypothetical protein [Sandaracinaceae bacterium]
MRRRAIAALVFVATLGLAATGVSDEPGRTPREHRRPPDQTYLTFPEWFLVHSPNELARYTADHSPSGFPFLGHVGQLWSSYGSVTEATSQYDLNVGYHVMILVIASSTTVEYGIRAGYETLVGRLAEATQTGPTTAEETFAAQVAQEYVDFINEQPWYAFDFVDALERLWTEVPLIGPDMIRKVERRYALTTELVAKASYGWLIGIGTAASYEAPLLVTAVVLEREPDAVPEGVDLEVLERFDDGQVLATLPRYEAFGVQASILAEAGARFVEIAGNRGPIVISAIVPAGTSREVADDVLFVQPILTRPTEERVVFQVPVADLADALNRLGTPDRQLEHVYDF